MSNSKYESRLEALYLAAADGSQSTDAILKRANAFYEFLAGPVAVTGKTETPVKLVASKARKK